MESKSYADSSDVDIFAHISYSTWLIYQFLKKKKIVLTSWNVMKALTSETACPRLFHYQKQVLVLAETCAYSLWAQPPEEDSKNNCYFIPLARNRRYWRTYIRSCLVGKSIDERKHPRVNPLEVMSGSLMSRVVYQPIWKTIQAFRDSNQVNSAAAVPRIAI